MIGERPATSQSVGTEQPDRAYALDLLRGVCALGIAAYHYIYWTYGLDLESLALFGVYVFFVLSALSLMIRYGDTFRATIDRGALLDFYRNRAARILPLLSLMALVAFVYLEAQQGGQSLAKAFLTGSGLFGLHMPGVMSNTPGAWSLGIELLFYALFPAVCLTVGAAGILPVVIALAFLVFAQQVVIGALPPHTEPAFWGQYALPLTFAPFFAAGIVVHKLGNATWRGAWLGMLLCLAPIFSFTLFFPDTLFSGGLPYIFLSAAAFGAVLFAYRWGLPVSLRPLAHFLGKISYGAYLSHWLVFEIAARISNHTLKAIVFAIGVPALALAIYHVYEMPARRWLRARNQSS